jgi:hypothetical protein
MWHPLHQENEGSPDLQKDGILLGHTKLESLVRCLGVEVDDALGIADQVALKALGNRQLPEFYLSPFADLLVLFLGRRLPYRCLFPVG